jgi:glycine/D-amino acid oxidase-like deaminating enzyme
MKDVIERRKFLKLAGLTAALGASVGFDSRPMNKKLNPVTTNLPAPGLKPVLVSSDRVIRTVVGLRPYRPSGFVLKSERLNDKTVIHNYGHGGGGVSLSWGTATLAVDLALKTQATSFAVLGCGVIGLSTARLLQRRGHSVTIYAKDLPPETTSNIAGAQWSPVSVFEKGKEGTEFMNQFLLASKISQRMFQDLVGYKYGVSWMKNYFFTGQVDFPGGQELYPGYKVHHDAKTFFGYPDVTEVSTMMIEPAIYLHALLEDFYMAGGKLKVRNFESAQAITHLQEKVIMNCTGLGAGQLFGDKEIIPIKGQLTVLLPQPEIDYAYVLPSRDNLLYMFPRKDGILLGGTYEKGNSSLEPDANESDRILKGHRIIAESLAG